MRFELTVRLQITPGPKRVSAMSDWSRDAARRFQEAKDARLTQDRKALHDEKIRQSRSPELWKKLVELFQQRCDEFNAEQGMSNTFSVTNAKPAELIVGVVRTNKTLKGSYDSTNHRFTFVSSTWKPAHFKLIVQVQNGSEPTIVEEEHGGPIDMESFVNDQLESLLEIR